MTKLIYRHKIIFSLVVLFVAIGVGAFIWLREKLNQIEPLLKQRIIVALAERFHAHVELDEFHLSIRGTIEAHGKGLRIWPQTSTPEAKPMIALGQFDFKTNLNPQKLLALVTSNQGEIEIPLMELNDLTLDLPPHSHFSVPQPQEHSATGNHQHSSFRIERLICGKAKFIHETDKPGK